MSNDLFRDALETAQKRDELVCLYRDGGNLRSFAVGSVYAVGLEDYSLREVTPEGLPDGESVGRIEDIIRIDRETRYARQIALLMESRELFDVKDPTPLRPEPKAGNCLVDALGKAAAEKLVAHLWIDTEEDDDSVYGVVQRTTESHVELDLLTEDGEPDGTAVFLLDDVAGLRVDGYNERRIALYWKHRTDLYL